MVRVIQDSDDDSDDELGMDVSHTERDASPKLSSRDASSTEALRRQIEAAHRAHLQSQSLDLMQNTPAQTDHNTRGSTAATELSIASNETSQGLPLNDRSTFLECLGILPTNQQQDQGFRGQILQPVGTTAGAEWVLDDTVREEYAKHNPNILFPEPSSTIPNATLTQQRVMEGIRAPAHMGSDTENGARLSEPNLSIPWSEYLKSPTSTAEHPKSSAQQPPRASPKMSLASSETSSLKRSSPPLRPQQGGQEFLTQNDRPLSQDDLLNEVHGHEHTRFAKHKAQPQVTHSQLPPESSATGKSHVHARSSSSDRTSNENGKSSCPDPASDDDLADLGFPKEQYKPRSSRSRSLKSDTQEVSDYSVRPEKVAKARQRVRSTPATISTADQLCTSSRVRQICKMGFTPSTSATALQRNNGNVSQSVHWLITDKLADDELVFQSTQTSQAGNNLRRTHMSTPKASSGIERVPISIEQEADADGEATLNVLETPATLSVRDCVNHTVDIRSPSKVQVIIPAKSPAPGHQLSQSKAKRRREDLDLLELESTVDSIEQVTAGKKRGRGRPKKATKIAPDFSVQQGKEKLTTKPAAGPGSPLVENARLAPVQERENLKTPDAESDSLHQSIQSLQPGDGMIITPTERATPELKVLPDRPEIEPITPERLKKTAPQQHPAGNRAKVTYRVGLSRRARIAPLLRTMKK